MAVAPKQTILSRTALVVGGGAGAGPAGVNGAGKGERKDVDLAEKLSTIVFEEGEGARVAGERRAPRSLHVLFFLVLSLACSLLYTSEPLFEGRG